MADASVRMYSIEELAKAWCCSTKTIRRKISAGRLAARRTETGAIRVPAEEVERYERSLPAA